MTTPSSKGNQAKLIVGLVVGVALVWLVVTARWSPWSASNSTASSSAPAASSAANATAVPVCSQSLCEVDHVTQEVVDKLGLMERQRLTLKNVTNAGLATLSLTPSVVDLQLVSSSEPLDLAPVGKLSFLTSLALTNVTVTSLAPLETTTVETLQLIDVKGVQDLAPVARMPHITDLSIRGRMLPTLVSLAGGHLHRLAVSSSGLTTMEGLDRIGGLEVLILGACPIGDLTPLENIQGLRELDLSWMPLPTKPSLPPHVTTLALVADHLSDVSFVRAHSELATLSLISNDITDLSPIASLTNLQSLSLDRNPNLKDIKPLRALSHLEALSLNGTMVDSLDAVAGLPLKTITLEDTHATSLAPLLKIKSLQAVEYLPKGFPARETDALIKANPKIRISRAN